MVKHTPTPWTFDHDWHRLPTIFGADKYKLAIIEKDRLEQAKANAALIIKAVNSHDALVKALSESRSALIAFKDAVEASQKMNGREYVGLGIQINDAIGHAWNALADVGTVQVSGDGK